MSKIELVTHGVAFVSTAVIFCLLDYLWLGVLMADFYKKQLGSLMLETPRVDYAMSFYLLYVIGLLIFCVIPAVHASSVPHAMLLGAALGALAYGTYDLSNMATLRLWSAQVVMVDIAWGAVASAIAAGGSCFLTRLAIEKLI